jgi:hypothetical protein
MGDVKKTRSGANRLMLVGEARVMNRKLEAGELDHSSTGSQVFVVKWCLCHCPRLGHRPPILLVSIRMQITIAARNATKL